ncbi:uncharacterized protein F5147DRAFT_652764 [Suillus discolor]|uniref:Uncharacterized protein n=1 Tax=Suillus discolor TaxID=1912936 RepID=A0A9P7JUE2_9AGAM|nr:uncharacterized protein F5147DRAFT_652764 [Suillus discolor]KAG2108383.1 hypothetical protein F5147DRAFT_652764 [Suillus discolor]
MAFELEGLAISQLSYAEDEFIDLAIAGLASQAEKRTSSKKYGPWAAGWVHRVDHYCKPWMGLGSYDGAPCYTGRCCMIELLYAFSTGNNQFGEEEVLSVVFGTILAVMGEGDRNTDRTYTLPCMSNSAIRTVCHCVAMLQLEISTRSQGVPLFQSPFDEITWWLDNLSTSHPDLSMFAKQAHILKQALYDLHIIQLPVHQLSHTKRIYHVGDVCNASRSPPTIYPKEQGSELEDECAKDLKEDENDDDSEVDHETGKQLMIRKYSISTDSSPVLLCLGDADKVLSV